MTPEHPLVVTTPREPMARKQASLSLLPGARVAHYRVLSQLGAGGMSRVFLAEEKALGRKVVVKVLPSDVTAGVNVERFRREIQVSAKLQHPHIVPVLTTG